MMQNRARSSRRNKVTVRWLPVELIIEIFRRVQKLIGRYDFKLNWKQSMKLDQEYCNNLLAFALMRQEWTAIAQAELFRNIILNDQSKTGQFLKLVRGNMELRRYADSATSIRFGHLTVGDYDAEGLDDDLNEIALYCPNVVEISCFRVDVKLDYFSNMKKLEKLNLLCGSVLPPPTSEAPIWPRSLSITLLSLAQVIIPSPLDPASLPLLRSLHLNHQEFQTIGLLLPQLSSLRVKYMGVIPDLTLSIQESTSITSLSIREGHIVELDDASKTVIKERIVEFRLIFVEYDETGDSTLMTIIAGSKVMKKVILDGVHLHVETQVAAKFLETLKVVTEACKNKNIELWKENFDVGNGKVDLHK